VGPTPTVGPTQMLGFPPTLGAVLMVGDQSRWAASLQTSNVPVVKLLAKRPLVTVGPAPAHADSEVWMPPVDFPVRVGRRFDPPEFRWLSGHRGVDVCPGVGTQIRSPRAGGVVYAGKLADRNVVSVRHSDGLSSTFEPVAPAVKRGANIPAGTVVGTLEEGHDNDCLHWGVKVNRDLYLNPLGLLLGNPVLKPWDAPAS
jgi:murein DD-endopeptidase MepM/ murein hydrolase activator NlpD